MSEWLLVIITIMALSVGLITSLTPANADSVISTIPGFSGPNAIAYDSANGNLYVTNQNNTISVVNPVTNTVVSAPILVGNDPQDIVFDPNNGYLYNTNYNDNTVTVINGATNTIVGNPITVGPTPGHITFDPNNGYLYVVCSGGVYVINGATNTIVGNPISAPSSTYYYHQGITFDPSNGYLYVGDANNAVDVINGATNTIVGSPIPVPAEPLGITFDPNNGYLYVAHYYTGSLSIVNTSTKSLVGSPLYLGSDPLASTFNPRNGNIYVSNLGANVIQVIDTSTNTLVNTIATGKYPGKSVFDSNNGNIYVVNALSNTISVISPSITSNSSSSSSSSSNNNGTSTQSPGQCIVPPSGLIHWWPSDGNYNDLIGGHTGTPSGGVTFASGKVAQAFSFDGTGMVNVGSLGISNDNQPFSMIAWINPASTPIGSANSPMIAGEGSTGSGFGNGNFMTHMWLTGLSNGMTSLRFEIGATQSYSQAETTGQVIPEGQWSLVAVTYDGSRTAAGIKLYVNGVLQSTTGTGSGFTGSGSSLDQWAIGSEVSGANKFTGLIDEIEIFNTAVPPQVIQSEFTADSAGKCKPTSTSGNGMHSTITLITPNSAMVSTGGSITYVVKVNDSSNIPTIPTGTVSWGDGGAGGTFTSGTSCTLSAGSCSITYAPANYSPASITMTATYAGDSYHLGSAGISSLTFNILHYTSTTLVQKSSLQPNGGPVIYVIKVNDTSNTKTTPTGTVSWNDGNAAGAFNATSCTLLSGACAFAYTLNANPPNVITINATYSGDGTHLYSSGVSQLSTNTLHGTTTTVTPNPATASGNSTTFTAMVADTSNPSGSLIGIVSWSDGNAGGTFNPVNCVLSANQCSITYILPPNYSGSITITATYVGDSSHSSSSGITSLSITLSQATSSAQSTSTIVIPQWVHNNAKWWSEGTVGDNDFVKGIQYLIQQKIIIIPSTTASSSVTSNQIPAWVKGVAGWWANEKISDGDFVQGIQYLIQAGIIKV